MKRSLYWVNRFIHRLVEAMLIEKMTRARKLKESAMWVSVGRGEGTASAKAIRMEKGTEPLRAAGGTVAGTGCERENLRHEAKEVTQEDHIEPGWPS